VSINCRKRRIEGKRKIKRKMKKEREKKGRIS